MPMSAKSQRWNFRKHGNVTAMLTPDVFRAPVLSARIVAV